MRFGKNQLLLLKEVFPKVKKDEMTGKYYLTPDTYIHLRLNKRKMKFFQRMCDEYNIVLYRLPERLSEKETQELFIKYNNLKKQLNDTKDEIIKKTLEEEIIQIRNKIALGYMEVIYRLINEKFPNLMKEPDSEDIYQIGYETLLNSIDKYDINRNTPFALYIKTILIYQLAENIWKAKRNTTEKIAKEIIQVLSSKDILSIEDLEELNPTRIHEKTRFSEERINFLLSTINLSHETSIYEKTGELTEESFEEELLEIAAKENIYQNLSIIIDLLPEQHKNVIKLYFGFEDGIKHNFEEISKILGFNTRERVRQIKEEALSILSIPIYLSAISSYSEDKTAPKENLKKLREMYIKKREDELEDIIINEFPKEYIKQLIEEFPQMYKEVLELYYGLNDGIHHNIKEISEILNKKEVEIRERKRKAIIRLALTIKKEKPYYETLIEQYIHIRTRKKGTN